MSNKKNTKKDTKMKKIIIKIMLTNFVCAVMIFVLLKEGDVNNEDKEIIESSKVEIKSKK